MFNKPGKWFPPGAKYIEERVRISPPEKIKFHFSNQNFFP